MVKFKDKIQTLVLDFRGFTRVMRFNARAQLLDSSRVNVDAHRAVMARSDIMMTQDSLF